VFRAAALAFEETVAVTERLLTRPEGPPEAILLTDNFYAEAVLHVLRHHRIRPGRDCRIIGFGETDLADRCVPRLSHYDLRVADQVSFCLEALFAEIQDPAGYTPHQQVLVPRYIRRET
jgi:DNA-binding LacI/PurR family transcriptional regulator